MDALFFFYFFDFFDFGLSWNDFGFLQLFLASFCADFLDFFGFCRVFTFLAFLLVGTTGCGMKGIYAIDWIRWG